MKVDQAEIAFTSYAKSIPDHKWGEDEETTLGILADELQKAYDEAGTPDIERIAL